MFKQKVEFYLKSLYGASYTESQTTAIISLVNDYQKSKPVTAKLPNERTAYLISYGDSISGDQNTPLATLRNFLLRQVGTAITDVHLLPMFPYTSDDGFSVITGRSIRNWETGAILPR